MPRSRPASNPASFHKHTGQYYVTRAGKRIYLGSDRDQALRHYHEIGLGVETPAQERLAPLSLTLKELANRFIATQRANWRSPETTLKCYTGWLSRLLTDHSGMRAAEFTVERFANWKLSLKEQGYSAESINHYLGAVRAMFRFAEDTELLEKAPRLSRVRNESKGPPNEKPLYNAAELERLLDGADRQLKTMILLALNCGFGPKDIHDLTWDHIKGDRVTLPRSKTDVSQTFMLWPETCKLLDEIRSHRMQRSAKEQKPGSDTPVSRHVFITLFGQAWSKDSVAEQFRKLCRKTGVPCHGFYRLRHCASTAISLVARPSIPTTPPPHHPSGSLPDPSASILQSTARTAALRCPNAFAPPAVPTVTVFRVGGPSRR